MARHVRTLLLPAVLLLVVFAGCQQPRPGRPPDRVMSARVVRSALPDRPATGSRKVRYAVADCHSHLVNMFQNGEAITDMLAAMDRCGVEHAVVFGMPLMKKWSASASQKPLHHLADEGPFYWYSATDVIVARAVLSLPAAQRARVHPFISGFNPTDRNAIDHVKRMLEWYPDLWAGIGEVIARHDDVTALTYGETARANHVALDAIYELAAERGLPVSIHSNIGSVQQREPIYLGEMEDALGRHPETRFIWCHAGIGRRIVIDSLTDHLRRLLTTYPNLYIDLSWVVFDNYLVRDEQPSRQWVELIEAFPNRFMIGSDVVGQFHTYGGHIFKYYILLDALRPQTANQVARDNLLSLLPAPRRGYSPDDPINAQGRQ